MNGVIDKLWAAGDGGVLTLESVRQNLYEIASRALGQIKNLPLEEEARETVSALVDACLSFCAGLVMDQARLIDCSLRAFQTLGSRIDLLQAQIEGRVLKEESFGGIH